MDIFALVMWPIKFAIEVVLVSWHWVFTQLGLPADGGVGWVLSVVGLVVVVRSAMIPLMVRQIKSQRMMMELAPELKKLQAKYKGKTDRYSREQMSREQMELYKNRGTSPFASCLPLLVQMPIFFGLYTVLNEAGKGLAGVGLLSETMAKGFANATLFGARLSDTLSAQFSSADPNVAVIIVATILVALMVGSQFFTQLQIMGKNISPETKASPMFKQQRMVLYFLPFVMVFSGVAFPLGVVFYWFVSNFWTMVQQYVVIRNMPNPGSDADIARIERLRRKGKLVEPEAIAAEVSAAPVSRQRQQPVSKKRKASATKPANAAGKPSTSQSKTGASAAKPAASPNKPTGSGSTQNSAQGGSGQNPKKKGK